MDELIGKRMGPYTVTERIGDGGMAIVYKAYQESLNRYVALKVLRDELARDQQFVARFRQEALGAANLDHPNIVHVYDAGAANGKYYIAMSYVDGGDLKGLIHQGAVEPDRAVAITIQLAEALDHAHKQGLIHRDVKPSNVLMTRDGRPLLTDFGIAKALYESRQLTRTGTSIGTPEYMAPEQAQGLPPDGRTDIYALGVVLFEMLAAKVPFCTDTPVATMYMHVHEPPPSLRQVQGAVPQWLENVVCKALAKNPDDRYATAGLFAAALRQGQESMRAAAWGATAAPDAATAMGPAVTAAGAAGAAAAGARRKRTPTPAGPPRTPTPSSDLPTAVGPSAAAAGAARTSTPSSDLPTAIGPTAAAGAAAASATPTPAEAIAAVGAAGAAAGVAGRAATPAPVEKKRPKAMIPILIAAIALLIVAMSASAALLLGGGDDDTPAIVTQVIIGEDEASPTPTATGEAASTPTATGEISATPTTTLTASPTTSATASPTASPTASATASPTTTTTPTHTPTRTPTVAPTATNTQAPTPTDTQPPPPPPPPEDTDTPVPPPPPPPTDTPVPPPPPPTQLPTQPPPP